MDYAMLSDKKNVENTMECTTAKILLHKRELNKTLNDMFCTTVKGATTGK